MLVSCEEILDKYKSKIVFVKKLLLTLDFGFISSGIGIEKGKGDEDGKADLAQVVFNFFLTGTLSGALSWVEEHTTDSLNHKRPYKTFTASAGAGYNLNFGEKGHFQIVGPRVSDHHRRVYRTAGRNKILKLKRGR